LILLRTLPELSWVSSYLSRAMYCISLHTHMADSYAACTSLCVKHTLHMCTVLVEARNPSQTSQIRILRTPPPSTVRTQISGTQLCPY